jgi:hypothetical protein
MESYKCHFNDNIDGKRQFKDVALLRITSFMKVIELANDFAKITNYLNHQPIIIIFISF